MSILHRVARHERALLLGGASVVALLAWAYVLRRASPMEPMTDGAMVEPHLISSIVMWFVMMVAMMLPSALPALLVFHAAQKRSLGARPLLARATLFASGYLGVWLGWSVLAALLQIALQKQALLSSDSAAHSPLLAVPILLVAGAYQFTPWKRACLDRCQAPQDFLVFHWRQGAPGALTMGAHHGLFCVGCCWALMAVLFVVGIMNVAWVALLAAIVLVEKAVARGPWMSRTVGLVLVASAAYVGYAALA